MTPVVVSDFSMPVTRDLNRMVPAGNSPASDSRRTLRSTERNSCGLFNQDILPALAMPNTVANQSVVQRAFSIFHVVTKRCFSLSKNRLSMKSLVLGQNLAYPPSQSAITVRDKHLPRSLNIAILQLHK